MKITSRSQANTDAWLCSLLYDTSVNSYSQQKEAGVSLGTQHCLYETNIANFLLSSTQPLNQSSLFS